MKRTARRLSNDAELQLRNEWVNQRQTVDGPRCADVLRVENLHAVMQTGCHQQGIPEGQGVAPLESLRFRPQVGDGKENSIDQSLHRLQRRPSLRLRKADRRQFSAGRHEFATHLPRQCQRPNRGNQLLGAGLLVRVAPIVTVQPNVGIKDVHEAHRAPDKGPPIGTRRTERVTGIAPRPRLALFPSPPRP